MVPVDIMNFTLDRLVKMCGEAGQAKALAKDLKAPCPGCPLDQIRLLVASFEVFLDPVPDVAAEHGIIFS